MPSVSKTPFTTTLTERRIDCVDGTNLEPGTSVLVSPLDVSQSVVSADVPGRWEMFLKLGLAWDAGNRERLWLSDAQALEAHGTRQGACIESYHAAVRQSVGAWKGKFPACDDLWNPKGFHGEGLFARFAANAVPCEVQPVDGMPLLEAFTNAMCLRFGGGRRLTEVLVNPGTEPGERFRAAFRALQRLSVWDITDGARHAYLASVVLTPVRFDEGPWEGQAARLLFPTADMADLQAVLEWLDRVCNMRAGDKMYVAVASAGGWEPNVVPLVDESHWVALLDPAGNADGWAIRVPEIATVRAATRNLLAVFNPATFNALVNRVREDVLKKLKSHVFRGHVRVIDVAEALGLKPREVEEIFAYLQNTGEFKVYTVSIDDVDHRAITTV